jgi:hypothetical protein
MNRRIARGITLVDNGNGTAGLGGVARPENRRRLSDHDQRDEWREPAGAQPFHDHGRLPDDHGHESGNGNGPANTRSVRRSQSGGVGTITFTTASAMRGLTLASDGAPSPARRR